MKNIRDLPCPTRPVKVIQFGGGVFLRGFFDWMLQKANDAGIYCGNAVIVRSKTAGTDPLAAQDYRYTHLSRDAAGVETTLVNSIAGSVSAGEEWERFLSLAENPETDLIVSNTTESGIRYIPCPPPPEAIPETFPARLCALLYRRYQAGLPGMLILPCELIDNNGGVLREYVLRYAADWNLGGGFTEFVTKKCDFRETLVDRIVSGAPSEPIALPYTDTLVNTSEAFHLWVIEGEPDNRLPFAGAGIDIRFVPDISGYRTLKVRILNGAHTSMIPYALLRGFETVGDCLADPGMRAFLSSCLFGEILPSLDFDPVLAREYADAVLTRFANPYLHHLCASISLNSVSKFRVRVLPSILAYCEKTGKLPMHLLFSLGQLLRFYAVGTPRDDEAVIRQFRESTAEALLADTSLWGCDLSGFLPQVARFRDCGILPPEVASC